MTRFDYCYFAALIVDICTVIVGWDWIVAASMEQLQAQDTPAEMYPFF